MASLAISFSLLMHRSSGKKKKKKKAISGSSSSRSPPPKEKEKEEVEKTVYLGANAGNHCTDWYVIKLSSKDCSKKKKTTTTTGRGGEKEKEPLFIKPILREIPIPWDSCFVSLNSIIYCTCTAATSSVVAEYFSSASDVLALDTTDTTPLQWKPVTAINLQKKKGGFSEAVVTADTDDDGKIYFFAGLETMDEQFMGQVFDPTKNEWEPINQSPSPQQLTFLKAVRHDFFALYDESESRIILGSRFEEDGFLLTYGLRNALWQTLPQKFTTSPPSCSSLDMYISRPVFFDKTLYWIEIYEQNIHDSGVYAYHLDLQMLFHGTIMGVHPCFWDCDSSLMQFLHFRDDKFYLLWRCPLFGPSHNPNLLRCERIRISKRVDEQKQQGSLTACVLSTKTYLLETEAYSLVAVVV